ncbi:methyltransferase domain-containing protein [Streptomyces rubellomurinus]|uniref:Methyltransferase domain-containing protein n=1 Tax=Streptomyces sp. Y1 TaxID=3238634 RepID=A0AB39TEP1_9ACTN|nr:methyltransferase domain-containing protein [Streptomyces rubellomurinus]
MNRTAHIGTYYDIITPLLEHLWGGNLHIGLWPDATADQPAEDDTAAVAAAGDRLTDLLLSELPLHPGHRFLDVGCGTGRPARRLARTTGAHVTGITISTTQVQLATSRTETAGLSHLARFQYADATDLPFPDRSFDGAWAIESLLHIPDTRRALAELRRVLTPGSPLLISDMILRAPDPERHDHSSLTPLTALRTHLEASGFQIEKITDLDEHLRHSLRRLDADLNRQRRHLSDIHTAQATDALTRILRKTLSGIGTTFGYVAVAAC